MSIDALSSVGGAVSPVTREPNIARQRASEASIAFAVDGSTPPGQGRAVAVDPQTALQVAARQIDSYLKSVGREVQFHVDADTDMTVVTVRDTATGEVVRQIPSEEALQLARHLEGGSSALLSLTV